MDDVDLAPGQPREQLGRTAMELLLDEVENKADHTHRQVEFQPELIVRESSQATATG
jgi:LacI family transcriptional regulator